MDLISTKTLFVILRSLLGCYLLWLALLYVLQGYMLFPTYAIPDLSAAKTPSSVEVSFLHTEDGERVEYWYQKSPFEESPTVVIFHGNGSTIDFTHPWAFPLRDMGFNVLIPEYRGYGRSTGLPSQATIRSDMIKIIQKVAEKPEVDLRKLVFFGESLGGGVAFDLVEPLAPSCIVTRSTFVSVDKIAQRYLAPGFLIRNRFLNDKVIASYDRPVFIAHGRQDRVIPFSHANELDRIAPNSVLYAVDSDHNDFPLDHKFWQSLEAFFKEHQVL